MSDLRTEETRSIRGACYVLAMANRHKGWARRWLKANGYGV